MRAALHFASCAAILFLCTAPFVRGQVPASFPGLTGGESARLRQFEERYRAASNLEATFLERYRENGQLVRAEAGRAYFQRPGKMRWDYEQPEKNTFLVDGKYAWFYAPTDHTATRMPTKRSEDWRTPLAFLTSGMKLARICAEVRAGTEETASRAENGMYRCELRGSREAKGAVRVADSVYFEVSPGGELARIVIPQEGGVRIEFTFKDWDWNPKLPDSLFRFEAPKGAVIVDGLLPESASVRQ